MKNRVKWSGLWSKLGTGLLYTCLGVITLNGAISIHDWVNPHHPAVQVVERVVGMGVPFTEKEFVGDCTDDGMEATVHVYLSDNLQEGVQGMYMPSYRVIAIRKTDLQISLANVVSHEVSHYVDDMTQVKGINDGETRAYMEGYFTDCVMGLITNPKKKNDL